MSIIGRIFGSDEAISKGIETVAKGFDALIYTEEEKSTDKAKSVTEARKMLIDWISSSQGQRLSRRVIALSITGVWLFMYVVSMFVNICAVWAEKPENVTATAKIIGNYADSMNGAVMLILGFYFAAPHLSDIVKPAIEKFSKRPDREKVNGQDDKQ